MTRDKSKRRPRKLSRAHRKTRRSNKKGGILNPMFRFKPIPDVRCSGNGKSILNRIEVEPFLDELIKYNNDASLKTFYLENCPKLANALNLWKNRDEQQYLIRQFKLGPYIPGKRRLYTYLRKIKEFSIKPNYNSYK